MIGEDLIGQSVSYKLVCTLLRYLFMSRAFLLIRKIIMFMGKRGIAISASSESYRLFMYLYRILRKDIRQGGPVTILSVLISYLSFALLVYGKVHYLSVVIVSISLAGVYFGKKGVFRWMGSVYMNSIIFKLLNKKI